MILAAGFGTRLAPLTETLPKSLVPVAGKPMIAHAIEKLKTTGCGSIVVNAFHHADLMEAHFRETEYGIPITVIREEEILGTGGGILNARSWLESEEPFYVHNADIISGFDLTRLADTQTETDALAVLALHAGRTTRPLAFDPAMNFLGKQSWEDDGFVFPDRSLRFGFCGIHCISPKIFHLGFPAGFSDIFDIYRFALERGGRIVGVVYNEDWWDLGSMEKIRNFERSLVR